jgi:hypothetical protein
MPTLAQQFFWPRRAPIRLIICHRKQVGVAEVAEGEVVEVDVVISVVVVETHAWILTDVKVILFDFILVA